MESSDRIFEFGHIVVDGVLLILLLGQLNALRDPLFRNECPSQSVDHTENIAPRPLGHYPVFDSEQTYVSHG
jgi:hypothetical protein